MRTARGLQGIVAAALLSMLLAACSGGLGRDKAGGGARPVTLRMATMEGRGAPYADGVTEFARQVDELSNGRLRIKVVWDGAVQYFGVFGPGSDQKVAGLVQNGKLDIAFIPARAWDELGVTSLQAMQAPFLISTEDLVNKVVQSNLAGEMMAGLNKAGVVGLALIPEGLRHPVGFRMRLLTRDDFAGAKIRALPSNASFRLLGALGSKPVDISGDDFSVAVAKHQIDGAESGFAWGGNLPEPGTFTANVTFYPKVNAVVANEKRFGRLSADNQEILRVAATRALRYVVQDGPTEADRAATYCSNGGKIAFASDADLAALERATRSVYFALEADPQTKALIDQIRAMRKRTASSGDAVAACKPANTAPATTTSGEQAAKFPEGVYRADLAPRYLIAKGMDSQTAYDIGGIRTLTFEDRHWRDHSGNTPRSSDCVGSYAVRAQRIRLALDIAQCGDPAGAVVMTARWKLEGGELTFFDIRVGRPLEWGGKPWKKIG
jgi:TRAP-type C4-dicarboxylate transport system substrate-binding protein